MREIGFEGGGIIHDRTRGMRAKGFESGAERGIVSQDCLAPGRDGREPGLRIQIHWTAKWITLRIGKVCPEPRVTGAFNKRDV